jgi:hypothetical protein
MSDSTRLSDLPAAQENITYQLPMQQQIHQPQIPSNTIISQPHLAPNGGPGGGAPPGTGYMPLNVHPNPYGNSTDPTSDLQPPPASGYFPPQQQRLPSRDIPMNTVDFTQDEAIQANYIPKPSQEATAKVNDYIKEYDDLESKRIREHEITKHRQYWLEETLRSYQIPFLIGILFFLFQMNVVSRLLFVYLGKWGYQEDGQMNTTGLVLKSVLFAGVYWAIQFILYNI